MSFVLCYIRSGHSGGGRFFRIPPPRHWNESSSVVSCGGERAFDILLLWFARFGGVQQNNNKIFAWLPIPRTPSRRRLHLTYVHTSGF